jgi:two-component system KDP operon response regulator KdpE
MAPETLVLAVDDEKSILNLIDTELRAQGFRVLTSQTGSEAVDLADQYRPDIAVLDLLMPDVGGLEVMRRLRERHSMPIILLTAMGGSNDKVRGLELGADDYLAKPFDPLELAARVRAVLRRFGGEQGPANLVTADDGRLEIDLDRRTVRSNGELVNLSRTEWLLLQYLAANPDKVMLNNQILTAVWGAEYRDELQYLRVWVFRLRQKLEENPAEPRVIKTRPGIGLMLCSDAGADALREAQETLSAR